MKDIPGIPQSHIVENFLHSLQQNNNDTFVAKFEISQVINIQYIIYIL